MLISIWLWQIVAFTIKHIQLGVSLISINNSEMPNINAQPKTTTKLQPEKRCVASAATLANDHRTHFFMYIHLYYCLRTYLLFVATSHHRRCIIRCASILWLILMMWPSRTLGLASHTSWSMRWPILEAVVSMVAANRGAQYFSAADVRRRGGSFATGGVQ